MSWEDDDFEVPTLNVTAIAQSNDEEEDLLLVEKREAAKRLASGPTPEQIALMEKKAEEDAIKMQNKLKMMELEKMTPEERRLREKKLVEEGDNQLALELFAGSTKGSDSSGLSTPKSGVTVNAAAIKNVKSHAGLASIVVQSKQDHITFGTLVAKKLDASTSDNIKLFFETFINTIESKIDSKELKIITDNLLKLQTKRNEEAAEKAKKEKAKKDAKADKKKKEAIFGEDYVDDLTDRGLDYEDRFGF